VFSGALLFAVMMGCAALAFASERALQRIREARRRCNALLQKKQQQVERLRTFAGATLQMKRELRLLQDTVRDLKRESDVLQEEIKAAHNPHNRIFVLDERRMGPEQAWVVVLAAPTVDGQAPAWSGGRRFMVWALDEIGARAKIDRRYPEAAGFRIIAAAPKPAGPERTAQQQNAA
jgi:hypothetical protein